MSAQAFDLPFFNKNASEKVAKASKDVGNTAKNVTGKVQASAKQVTNDTKRNTSGPVKPFTNTGARGGIIQGGNVCQAGHGCMVSGVQAQHCLLQLVPVWMFHRFSQQISLQLVSSYSYQTNYHQVAICSQGVSKPRQHLTSPVLLPELFENWIKKTWHVCDCIHLEHEFNISVV